MIARNNKNYTSYIIFTLFTKAAASRAANLNNHLHLCSRSHGKIQICFVEGDGSIFGMIQFILRLFVRKHHDHDQRPRVEIRVNKTIYEDLFLCFHFFF